MRLISVQTLEVREFPSPKHSCPRLPYDILSHRWGEDEITFSEFDSARQSIRDLFDSIGEGQSVPFDRRRDGIGKIAHLLHEAKSHDVDWVWIDTSCIDKSSSTELSEAINSMFRWYELAAHVRVYLEDVSTTSVNKDGDAEFNSSEWFRRGRGIFLDTGTICGLLSRRQLGLNRDSSSISKKASIAQRFSWAAHRKKTRIEDGAYSLLGIFEVNMPMLYGEGEKAFLSLQIEILKITDDESLFAWHQPFSPDWKLPFYGGLLAPEPSWFGDSAQIVSAGYIKGRRPIEMTSKGIKIEEALTLHEGMDWVLPLNCVNQGASKEVQISTHGDFVSSNIIALHLIGASSLKMRSSTMDHQYMPFKVMTVNDSASALNAERHANPLELEDIGTIYVLQPG